LRVLSPAPRPARHRADQGLTISVSVRGHEQALSRQERAFAVHYGWAMDHDSLDEMPADSRTELVAQVRAVLGVDVNQAEDLIRSAEPFWDAMERAGGLVDSWGGGEFCVVLPRVLAYVRAGAP
jgi:hypothetical protein